MKHITKKFKLNPSNTAIIDNKNTWTYKLLSDKIEKYQKQLERKTEAGAVVCLATPVSFNAISLFFALFENNNIIFIDPNAEKSRSTYQRSVANYTDYLITIQADDDLTISKNHNKQYNHKLIKTLRESKNAGLILASSGTTGEPKVMLHDLDRLVNSYPNNKIKNLRIISLLGFDHIGGLDIILRALWNHSTLVLTSSFDPEIVCRLIEKYAIDVLPGSPSFFRSLLISEAFSNFDLSSVKVIGFGSEPMPQATLLRLKEVFPAAKMQQKFGTSETNAIRIQNSNENPLSFKINKNDANYIIVNNELWIKSSAQILGYLSDEHNHLIEKGWFRTGDIVEEKKDGSLQIIGRLNDIINVGGEKVLPSEVEDCIMTVPGVKDCKVFGQPNPITGKSVNAEVVTNEDFNALKKRIMKNCRDNLEAFKIPTRIKQVDSIDMTSRLKRKR